MTRDQRGDHATSYRAEAMGWVAFLLFVVGVYSLRRVLDRSARER